MNGVRNIGLLGDLVMRWFRCLVAHFLSAFALAGLLSVPALAQDETPGPDNLPKSLIAQSEGGVDLMSGQHVMSNTDLSVGSGFELVRHTGIPEKADYLSTLYRDLDQPFAQFSHNFDVFVVERAAGASLDASVQRQILVSEGGRSRSFDASFFNNQVTAVPATGTPPGAYLTSTNNSASNRKYVYTADDGRIIYFRLINGGDCVRGRGKCAYAEKIVHLDGTTFDFTYSAPNSGSGPTALLRRVSDNRGQVIVFEYVATATGARRVSKACIFASNQTPPATNACPAGASSTTYIYGSNGKMTAFNDMIGAQSGFTSTFNAAAADAVVTDPNYTTPYTFTETYTRPGYPTPYLTNILERSQSHQTVKSQAYAASAGYQYVYWITSVNSDVDDLIRGTSTRSDGSISQAKLAVYDRPGPLEKTGYGTSTGPAFVHQSGWNNKSADYCFPITVHNSPGCALTYAPLSVTSTDGSKEIYTYLPSAEGKISQILAKPNTGSADPDIARSFTYDCTPKPCKVATATDGRGKVTDYSWDPVHKNILTETLPADAAGVRPQKRYTYAQFYSQYRNSAGVLVQSPTAVWLLTQVSECKAGVAPACVGTVDETKTTITYTPVGLYKASSTIAAGDGSLSATTSWTYDDKGNKLTEDGPLPGTADTTRWRYDVMRRVIGEIEPDPDGAGPRPRQAMRNTFDTAGRQTKVETGTAQDQSDTAWQNFTAFEAVETTYDIQNRKLSETRSAGGITYSVTHYKYDSVGRLLCTAVRMDPAQWASQTDACVPQLTGPQGPDRVTRLSYNLADQIIKMEEAVGTSVQSDEETKTYTLNGKLATIKDGENNLTTYEYDGHDRLSKTRFPVAAQGANASSTTDYEQLSYDANNNVTKRRLRDGQNIDFTYDPLNRVSTRTENSTLRRIYEYDLFGRTSMATWPNWYNTEYKYYNALGFLTQHNQSWDQQFYQYDAAGRRTRLTWGDGFYVNYDYDVIGNVTAIRENGATSGAGVLATYGYDNLGRLTRITRGNGTVTNFTFDPLSRLSSFDQDLPGTSNDLSVNGLAYNPASQITSITRNNDAYAWTGHFNVSRPYTVNGLNQMTQSGTTALGYDGRGNLTSSGSATYYYDAMNQMVGTNFGVPYIHSSSLDQLHGYDVAGGTNVRFAYDGPNLTSEFAWVPNGTSYRLRRYVHGPGTDEPLVWYEGSGTTDRRWLHTDERGSVIAVTNGAGSLIARHSYDEFGILRATDANGVVKTAVADIGRFSYTGQTWIPEAGLYYYKARMYSPTLGRFMQTDPIGYGDGINWYDYVGGDPVNGVDPDGQWIVPVFRVIAEGVKWCARSPACRVGAILGGGASGRTKSKPASPPSTLKPGPSAKDSIPARGPERDFTREERNATNENMREGGCHTCGTREPGTKSGDAIPDHQPASGLAEPGEGQRLYPHCKKCSDRQMREVRQEQLRRRREEVHRRKKEEE